MFLIPLLVLVFAKEENDLQILFDKNIEQFLQKHETSLLFFYTPSCGHCDRFLPEIEKAAKTLKDDGFIFGKVDGHNYKDIAKQFEVNGFPSVILSQEHGKKWKKFEGPRQSDTLILWIFEQLNKGSEELKSFEEIQQKIQGTQKLFFLYMAENDEDRGLKRYIDYSHFYPDVEFYHTFVNEIQIQLGFTNTDSLVAYKKYDKSPVVYQPKQIKVSDLKAFIETNMFARLEQLNEQLLKMIFKQDRSALVLILDENQKKDQNARDALKSVSLEHPHEDHLLFIQCSLSNIEELQKYTGDDIETPLLIGFQKYGLYKYKFNQAFTKQNLEQFVIDFKNNKLQKYYKSQKLDIKENVYATQLNGNSYFKSINGNQEIVILYYNSFQQEHQLVIDDFNAVAQSISQINKKIKFGFIDVTKNELFDYQDSTDIIRIRFYKSSKDFVKFIQKSNKIQQDRLIHFIKDNSNYEFDDEHKTGHHDDL